MNLLQIIGASLGTAIIAVTLWQIRRHGTVPPKLDFNPDDDGDFSQTNLL